LHANLDQGLGRLQPGNIVIDSCGKLRVLRIAYYCQDRSTKEKDIESLGMILFELCTGLKEKASSISLPEELQEFSTYISSHKIE
jgi:hypothetical protein